MPLPPCLQAASRRTAVRVQAVDTSLVIGGSTAAMLAVGTWSPASGMGWLVHRACASAPWWEQAHDESAPPPALPLGQHPAGRFAFMPFQRRKVAAAVQESGPKTTGSECMRRLACLASGCALPSTHTPPCAPPPPTWSPQPPTLTACSRTPASSPPPRTPRASPWCASGRAAALSCCCPLL